MCKRINGTGAALIENQQETSNSIEKQRKLYVNVSKALGAVIRGGGCEAKITKNNKSIRNLRISIENQRKSIENYKTHRKSKETRTGNQVTW